MRFFIGISLVVALGCQPKKSDDLSKKMGEAKQAEQDEKAAAAAKAEAERVAGEKAAAEAEAQREAERQERLADMPAGNTATTEAITDNDADKAIIEELGKSGTFEKVAKRAKSDRKRWEPLMIKLLGHTSANVRTQVARVFVINKWKTEEVTAALSAAMLAEADDDVRDNWGRDIRLYLSMETPKDVEITTDLLPAAQKAFQRARAPNAMGTLAETLCMNGYEKALPDIYKRIEGNADADVVRALLPALKRLPREAHKEKIERYLAHSDELIRLRAKEVMEAIAAAPAEDKSK